MTWPLPSAQELDAFYKSTEHGMSASMRAALADNPDAVWHEMCARRLVELSRRNHDDVFTWIDIGAGAGEMAVRLAREFPRARGIAIDLHERPPALRDADVEWRRIDMTESDWSDCIDARPDLAFATGVWEHVMRPDLFARAAVAILAPGGVFYATTPNYGSLARKVLGTRWPYYNPGEHLCMPTPHGAQLCLANAAIQASRSPSEIKARAIAVQYSIGYVLAHFGLPQVNALARRRVYLPSGAMESVIRLA